jgi:lipoyl(octanoyl) transferase
VGDFGICAEWDHSHPGVWVNGEELGAIGLSVRRWVSMHGVALNVNPIMEHFTLIHPCGLRDRRATSMALLLGYEVSLAEVINRMLLRLAEVFEVKVKLCSLGSR